MHLHYPFIQKKISGITSGFYANELLVELPIFKQPFILLSCSEKLLSALQCGVKLLIVSFLVNNELFLYFEPRFPFENMHQLHSGNS